MTGEYNRLASVGINDAEFSVRTVNALQRSGRYKTLLDLDRDTDDNLMRIPHLGRKSIREIREVIQSVRARRISLSETVMLWAMEHETLILAMVNGEAHIVATASSTEKKDEHAHDSH